MVSQASVEFLIRRLTELHAALLQQLQHFLNHLVGENKELKQEAAERVIETSRKLQESMAGQDTPGWLKSLTSCFLAYQTKEKKAADLVGDLVVLLPQIRDHKWAWGDGTEVAFDFDSIYEHFKQESRIPELFDKIVQTLEKISQSDDIDSRRVLGALNKLISTVKKNRNGSFFSIFSTWDFLINFLEHFLWAELEKIPALGSLISSLAETLKDMDEEMGSMRTKMVEQMRETCDVDFPFLTYSKVGKALPSPAGGEGSNVEIEA